MNNLKDVAQSLGIGGFSIIARDIGVTPQTVQQWARGKSNIPILRVIEIAAKYSIKPQSILPNYQWEKLGM